MAVNKVVMNTANGEETLIDLTGDTVTADTLAEGVIAHDASGARIVGTMSANQDIYRHEIRFYCNSSGRMFDILATIYNKTSTPFQSAYVFNNNFLLKEGTYGYGSYIPVTGIYRQSSSASIYGVHKMCYGGDPVEIIIGLNSISGNTISSAYFDTSEGTFTDRVTKVE